jgi:hypothetical protein
VVLRFIVLDLLLYRSSTTPNTECGCSGSQLDAQHEWSVRFGRQSDFARLVRFQHEPHPVSLVITQPASLQTNIRRARSVSCSCLPPVRGSSCLPPVRGRRTSDLGHVCGCGCAGLCWPHSTLALCECASECGSIPHRDQTKQHNAATVKAPAGWGRGRWQCCCRCECVC